MIPFVQRPLPRVIRFLSLAPLVLLGPQALARDLDNEHLIVGPGHAADSYLLRNESTLTATDASIIDIQVRSGSSLTLNRSQVTASGYNDGVGVSGSTATITSSTLTAGTNATGVSAADNGAVSATVTVVDSTVTGGRSGGLVSGGSQLNLLGSTLSGTGAEGSGLFMSRGNVLANDSSIVGAKNGVWMLFDPLSPAPASLILENGSSVTGQNGSAILVDGFDISTPVANIEVRNQSTLHASNDTLLEVKGGGVANLLVNNSQLSGNIDVQAGSSATLQLENAATFTGQLNNVERLAVNSNATWAMVGDAEIATLTMDGGAVKFGELNEFHTLSVGDLSGNGTFIMGADFASGRVDFLDVTGSATGSHAIALASSGADPAADSLHVVRIGSGDAHFALQGGPVDLGAFSYDLVQRDSQNWFLDTTTRVISPGTQSVMALFNAAPTVWYGELSTLRSRMGELRMGTGQAGGWMRSYGNKFDVDASAGVAYRQVQQGISFGADAPLPVGDGQWLVGLLGGYSQSDLDLGRGTSGTVDSYYLGAYGTWLDQASGYYIDAVLKYNRFQNSADVRLSDGKKTKGDYHNNGLGASVEVGRHLRFDQGYFVEPYGQLSAVQIQGKDYQLDNGLSAEGDSTGSLLGKVGATVGRQFDLGEGKAVQPYLRAAYVHEFSSNNEVKVNRNAFNNDLSGSRGELGVGVAMTVTDKVSLHAEFDHSQGHKVDQPWGANLGLRYRW